MNYLGLFCGLKGKKQMGGCTVGAISISVLNQSNNLGKINKNYNS